ncbi:MAG: hypothetical protein HKN54_07250 [Flavobacteriaceae bacterium]|nr:hypothetical protein [Flavobacteriaceae bacterium]
MKLRILNNSIRFRLSMTDLDTLVQKGSVTSKLPIAHGIFFSFGIQLLEDGAHIHTNLSDNQLSFSIPKSKLQHLQKSNEVGIYETLIISDKESLTLTIEKDFKCLTPRSEDETDLFPNPREHH